MSRKLDTSPQLPKEEKIGIQKIVETSLYYARAVDPKMLVALRSINLTNLRAIKQPLNPLNNYWINVTPVQMHLYTKIKVEWFSGYIVTALICHNPRSAAGMGVVSF